MEPEIYLFHCKESVAHFRDALLHGLWPRHCEENFDWLYGNNLLLAHPMVCFTAIPLTDAAEHKQQYGAYALVIRHEVAKRYQIKPVTYLDEDGSEAKAMRVHASRGIRRNLDAVPPHDLANLPFIKPRTGFQNDRDKSVLPGTTLIQDFEDAEREWRHIPAALAGQYVLGIEHGDWRHPNELLGIDPQELRKADFTSNQHRLKIAPSDVWAIYVPGPAEVKTFQADQDLAAYAGKISVWP